MLGTRVAVSSNGFRVGRWPFLQRIKWNDILGVDAVFQNKVTYDEVFLVIRTRSGNASIGELDIGFADFEEALSSRVGPLPGSWRAMVSEANPVATLIG